MMDNILTELEQKIHECLRTYLPEINKNELEGNGTVYYMNGKNGTEFDWHVNDRLSTVMMFYDDEDKLGAVKATNYIYLQSLFTMLFAWIILHERITWMAIAGAVILILGMIRAERK